MDNIGGTIEKSVDTIESMCSMNIEYTASGVQDIKKDALKM